MTRAAGRNCGPAGPSASAETVPAAAIESTPATVELHAFDAVSADTASVEITYSCANDDQNTYYLHAALSQENGPRYVFGDPAVLPGCAAATCTGVSITQTLELVRSVSGDTDPRASQPGDGTLEVSLLPLGNSDGRSRPTRGAPRSPVTGFAAVLPSGARSYTFTGLAPGHSYNLSLQALNSAGVGASVGITVTTLPTAPSAPVSVSVVPGSTTAVLRWGAPANTGGAAITGYLLSRPGFTANLPATARTHTFSRLRPATSYTFTVQAKNAAGLGTAARIRVTTVAARPLAPVSVRATPRSTSVVVSWSPPASNGGAPLTGYRLSRSGFAKGVSATTRSYTFTGLRAGTTYNLYVQAKNRMGLSTATGVTVRTIVPPPPARAYRNCTALNAVYRHGVGRTGAVDRTSGIRVTDFYVSNQVYAMNDGRVASRGQYDLDRDNDGIACEKR